MSSAESLNASVPGILSLPSQQLNPALIEQYYAGSKRRWTYILANNVPKQVFNEHCIYLKKPAAEMVPAWIKRLIAAGQTRLIVVQDLQCSPQDAELISQLCRIYEVVLVNLQPAAKAQVIPGPWLH